MIDRESTLANPEIVQLLKSSCVNVALDQAYQRRQRDGEGEFYRKIATQGPRKNMQGTTQGFYVASPDGNLLGYTNHRSPQRVLSTLQSALGKYEPKSGAATVELGRRDPWWNIPRPADSAVVRVHAKVLGGYEQKPPRNSELANRAREIFQTALSRDNLWITADEIARLKTHRLPQTLSRRILRFHLVDNTRGEPPMWRVNDIVQSNIALNSAGEFTGTIHLKSADGKREFQADVLGFMEFSGDDLTRFDLVAKGKFRGAGRYTGGAPDGEFPLAVSFMLADGKDIADEVKPQGIKVVGQAAYLGK